MKINIQSVCSNESNTFVASILLSTRTSYTFELARPISLNVILHVRLVPRINYQDTDTSRFFWSYQNLMALDTCGTEITKYYDKYTVG